VSTISPTRFQAADCLKFYELPPSAEGPLFTTWHGRGQNFIVAYTTARDGAVLERLEQGDEYMLILPQPSTAVTVSAGDENLDVEGHSLVIVPPGKSTVTVRRGGMIVRVFTSRATDLAALCVNRSSYVEPDPHVAPYRPWPAPADAGRIRRYGLDVPEKPGRFGRIFRSSNLMVNVFYPQGPRDVAKMTPHHHDDFQQAMLLLDGECIHHLRWPWGADLRLWQEDEHLRCGAPSLSIVPPPAIHTSQFIGANNLCVDVFSPPREDFCANGWVLNNDDYPMPARASAPSRS